MRPRLKGLVDWFCRSRDEILAGLIVTIVGGTVVAVVGNYLNRPPTVSTPTTIEMPMSEGPWDCSSNSYDCSDFSSCDVAKEYFLACPGDPSWLDEDNDGVPCEDLCQ
jgi:hypothetical protein